MARLRLDLPTTFPFATELTVRVTDLNYGGHLGHDRLLALLHEARVRFLRLHGLTEAKCDGAGLVVGDAALVYKAEAFGGDVLRIEIALAEIERVGCGMYYRVPRPADGRLMAQARIGLVFLDPATRRPTAVPAAIRALAEPGS